MKVSNSYKDIWKISYPIMLGSLATTVLNLTDTAFMARVGNLELAAMAIGSIFHFLLFMIGYAISTGAQIIIARRAGEDNRIDIGHVFDHTFIILFITGISLFVVCYFFASPLFDSILKSEGVSNASTSYIRIRSFGLLIGITGLSFRSFFVGIGRTAILTTSAIVMTVINIILDYIFIFGMYGFEPMGIKGAALASVIAEIVSVLILLIFPFIKLHYKPYNLLSFSTINFKQIKSIINISSPLVLQNVISMSSWFIFFVLIEKMGERELAISNIVRAVYMVLMTPIWGFSSATNSMVSNLIGQNKIDDIKILVIRLIKMSLILSIIIMAADYLSGPFLLNLTSSDSSLIIQALGTYHVVLVAMIFFSAGIILLSAVAGTGNTKAAMVIEIINISFYLSYVYICTTIPDISIEITWAAEIIYWVMMGILSILFFKFYEWRNVIL